MKQVIVNLNKEEVLKTILKNKQIDDKIYFMTIKDLVGSGSLKQLKYHCKRALKNCFKKDNTFLKFDYLSTIQNDEDNYKDNIFLKQEFAYHNHTLAITKLTKKEIELGIENYHLRFSEKKIDIRINQITEWDFKEKYIYITRQINELGEETIFSRITNRKSLPQGSAEVEILPECLT